LPEEKRYRKRGSCATDLVQQKTEGQKIFGDVQIARDEIGEAREAPFLGTAFPYFPQLKVIYPQAYSAFRTSKSDY